MRPTFKKEERLTGKQAFEHVFQNGKTLASFPFRFIWVATASGTTFPVQLGISVPKRSFAKAVTRNMLKRRIRESYRKNKHPLYEVLKKKNLSIELVALYTAKDELSYSEIEKKMIVSLQKLAVSLK